MKKLDNKGWGLTTLIIFICIFAIFLLVVAFLIWNLNQRGITKIDTNTEYIALMP